MVSLDVKKKALVLGGKSGMLGQALMRIGIQKNFEMFSLGREDGDVLDMEFLENSISKVNPDFIFNAIAYTAVDLAEDEESQAYLLNRTLPDNLARIVKNSSCHCIHYGTDFVFDGKNKVAYTENDVANPLSVYGASKLAGEQLISSFDNCAILRTAWLFGCGKKNFVTTILNLSKNNPVIKVVHDQKGSPTCTYDLAEMSFIAAENKACGIYNAVNSGEASWCDLASEAISLMGLSNFVEPITTEEWEQKGVQKAVRPKFSVLSTAKFSEQFNYKPRPWVQALREYLFECLGEFNPL